MKINVHCFLLIGCTGLACACGTSAREGDIKTFGDMAWEESATPLRPGVPGESPFWNNFAERFIYAPAFNYNIVESAAQYRYEIFSENDSGTYSFESDVPYAPLSPVWAKMPVSNFTLTVVGLSGKGDSVGLAGEGRYYRAAPFNGIYHEPVLPYDSSAFVALDKLMHKDYVNYWLEHKSPDPDYPNYRYPAKIMSALIVGAVAHARLKPNSEDAKRSEQIAKIVADYLTGISYPQNSVWPDFPPSYHGPRIGKNPDSHMQLTNNLTIIGADAGHAYLDLHDLTGEEKYLKAARKIADTYVKNQMENGTWYLYVNHETGEPIAENLAIPTSAINFFDRLRKQYKIGDYEKASQKALNWTMENPVKTFDWQAQFEDVKAYPPHRKQSREQACDLASYLFRNKKNIPLAEELTRFAEDQFVIWEKPMDFSVRKNSDNPGWKSKNWITPSVQEQYGFWMPVNRTAGIMIQTYWDAYQATEKEIYLAKAKSIANAITVVQEANDGDYPTMFIKTPWHKWLNSAVYPAKVLMTLNENLKGLNDTTYLN
jgi:hypothetical protein